MIPVWKTARAKKEWNLPHEFSWQKVSMTKPKADWWSSQDLVSKRSMCNTDHHFQVKTKVSPVNWKGWQVRNTSSIYIHLILNKVIVNGHWPLRCDNRSHSVPHSILIASDRPCAHCAWRRYFHQFIFLAAWTMHFSVKRDLTDSYIFVYMVVSVHT